MDIEQAIGIIGAAIRQAITDQHSNAECEFVEGAHKLSDCADYIVNGLERYVEQQNDEITPGDLVDEFLRLRDGS